MPIFGQLVIGPPGAGKTTYCDGMQQMFTALKRPHALVNLDPANDALPYECAVNVRDLVNVEDVMEEFGLGPNGALIYAMEYVLENIDWLKEEINTKCAGKYVLFDMPGQVELYTHNNALREITEILRSWDVRLVAVHLVDSVLCTDAAKYISAVWVSLAAMMQLELPHVNVLSKVDLMKRHHSELDFRLEHYTDVDNLPHIIRQMNADDHPMARKFAKFNEGLCEVIEDYSLVGFTPLDIQEKESVVQVLLKCDQANGHVFGAQKDETSLFDVALTQSQQPTSEYLGRLQEEFCEEDVDIGAPPPEEREPGVVCGFCEVSRAGQQCGRCKAQRYCSRECQRLDWPRHKYLCTPF